MIDLQLTNEELLVLGKILYHLVSTTKLPTELTMDEQAELLNVEVEIVHELIESNIISQ